jgi:hypothetical protein
LNCLVLPGLPGPPDGLPKGMMAVLCSSVLLLVACSYA